MAILETLTADGPTDEFTAQGNFRIEVDGDFGGGTFTVQEKIDGIFKSMPGTEKTLAFSEAFDLLGVGGIFRFNLSGSTSPNLNTTAIGPVSRIGSPP